MVRKLFALPSISVCLTVFIAVMQPGAARADSPDVLIVGDSQAQGIAGALQRRYLRSRDFHVVDRSKIGTGLNSRSTYDWEAVVTQLATTEHAPVAIVMFGANDRPPVRVKGVVDPGLSDKFSKAYSARVTNIVKSLRAAKINVIWLGDPVVKDADYAADMQMLNQVMEPAAEKEGAQFVSLWDITGGDAGTYNAFGKALDGQTKRLRADDGVHFTPTGYDLIAARLDPILKTLIPAKPPAPAPAEAAPADTKPAADTTPAPPVKPLANASVTQ